ncbi:unnamed protein product [Larinioides sclopetarius]|uniref:Peptidase M12A domain-containing protein n=1 Tax=Larinioides sclopetarius TaxID=280406 RepID=A0AAV2BB41_9ARAC
MGTEMLSSCLLFCVVLTGAFSSTEFPNHTLLRIDDVNLVKPAEGKRSDDPMFNEGLEGGDILLTPSQREQARQGEIWSTSDNSKWKRVVPYVIDSKGYTAAERAAISKAITTWNRDMLWCYSNLGRVGGQQPISLRANGCLTPGTILHEMAHTNGSPSTRSRVMKTSESWAPTTTTPSCTTRSRPPTPTCPPSRSSRRTLTSAGSDSGKRSRKSTKARSSGSTDMGTAILSSCLLFCVVLTGAYSSFEFQNHTYVEPEYLENLFATGQYEEFARLLRIDDVNLVKPADGKRSVDPMFNEGLEEGDILLTPSQREQARQGVMFATSLNSKWKREVPYVINKKNYTLADRTAIMKAIMTWNRDLFSNIRFRPRLRLDRDYVMFFDGSGCYSYLGKVGGQQPISLQAKGCLSQGTILHEMAHAAGMVHEQTQWQSQYEKTSYEDILILGPYDYYSVMHYPIQAPGTNKPAFEVLQKGIDLSRIGQREGQTELDKDKLKRLYV